EIGHQLLRLGDLAQDGVVRIGCKPRLQLLRATGAVLETAVLELAQDPIGARRALQGGGDRLLELAEPPQEILGRLLPEQLAQARPEVCHLAVAAWCRPR